MTSLNQESYLEKNCNLKAISSIRVNNDGLLELRKLFLRFLLSEVRHDTAHRDYKRIEWASRKNVVYRAGQIEAC